jgi:hypothetical protein
MIRCNMCEVIYTEDELEILYLEKDKNNQDTIDNKYPFKGCKDCKTDAYLMEIKENMKIIILDYSDNIVYINNISEDYQGNEKDYLIEHGFELGNIKYMIVKTLKLEIE